MSTHHRRAFTLVELMIVIAVIGILTGSLVAVLRTGGKGPALQAAQATLSGLVSSARARAALDNNTATVIIWANSNDSSTYLRRAAIAVRVDTNNDGVVDDYAIQGGIQDLPRGIFFVPENADSNLPAMLEPLVDWRTPSTLVYTESQASGNGTTSSSTSGKGFKRLEDGSPPQWQNDPDAPATYYESIAFDAYGNLVSKVGNNLISYLAVAPGDIATGTSSTDRGVIFRSVDNLRGLKLSAYGLPILLNEKAAFDTN